MSQISSVVRQRLPPAVLLMGPTASGKTWAAAHLAKRFPVEIISVDSAQVYRHMNIGTAKPPQTVLQATPHHLIDILDPTERYSAARFREDALRLMEAITRRGRIPLLAGGTMLYFKALREGLSPLPGADATLRASIDEQAREAGWPALHAELARIDPRTARRLEPNDAQRIQRALEIYRSSGTPMSELLERKSAIVLPYRIIALGLEPNQRTPLHQRIAQRFEAMLEQGLVEELRGLRSRYALDSSLPSMRAVGYRQAWQYLDGSIDLNELRAQGIAATRQLAKRQLTWLRSTTQVERFDCLAGDLLDQLEAYAAAQLE